MYIIKGKNKIIYSEITWATKNGVWMNVWIKDVEEWLHGGSMCKNQSYFKTPTMNN